MVRGKDIVAGQSLPDDTATSLRNAVTKADVEARVAEAEARIADAEAVEAEAKARVAVAEAKEAKARVAVAKAKAIAAKAVAIKIRREKAGTDRAEAEIHRMPSLTIHQDAIFDRKIAKLRRELDGLGEFGVKKYLSVRLSHCLFF